MHREYYFVKPRLVEAASTTWWERCKYRARHTVQAVEAALTRATTEAELVEWLQQMRDVAVA